MKLRPPSIFFVFETLSIPETIGQLEKKVIDYLQQLAEDESLSLRVHCPAYQWINFILGRAAQAAKGGALGLGGDLDTLLVPGGLYRSLVI